MNWTVEYSARARQDLRDIYEYIAYGLLARDTASRQIGRIMKEIRSLDKMPQHPSCPAKLYAIGRDNGGSSIASTIHSHVRRLLRQRGLDIPLAPLTIC